MMLSKTFSFITIFAGSSTAHERNISTNQDIVPVIYMPLLSLKYLFTSETILLIEFFSDCGKNKLTVQHTVTVKVKI